MELFNKSTLEHAPYSEDHICLSVQIPLHVSLILCVMTELAYSFSKLRNLLPYADHTALVQICIREEKVRVWMTYTGDNM